MVKLNWRILTKVQQNLPIILLLPAIFGGLWQIFELSKMSISFIRFFSPTQLLPDGLMILFMISIIYLLYKLENSTSRATLKRKYIIISQKKPKNYNPYDIKKHCLSKLKYIENPIYRQSAIPAHIIIILGSSFIIYSIFFISDAYNTIKNNFNFITFAILLIFFISISKKIFESMTVLVILFRESQIFNRIKKYFPKQSILHSFLKISFKGSLVILLPIILFSPLFIFNFFHEKYLLPNNLKNLDYIQDSLNNKDYVKNRISYLNDKYIFIEHTTYDNNVTIEILKFEKLFH